MAASRIIKSQWEFIDIPEGCVERFLPPQLPATDPKRRHGITMAGISFLNGGYRLERRPSRSHLLVYTLNGRGVLNTSPKAEPVGLGEGDLFIAPAGSNYAYRTDGALWEIAWLHLDPAHSWASVGTTARVRKALGREMMLRLMTGYLEEYNLQGDPLSPALEGYLKLMTIYIQRELENANSMQRDHNPRLKAILDGVQKNLGADWSIPRLAELAGISRAQLHRNLAQLTGKSPMETIRVMRMERASELLTYPWITLSDIAENVGYDSAFSLSKAFKRYSGSSPAEFRKNALQPGGRAIPREQSEEMPLSLP